MWDAPAEEALSDIELVQRETTASRREEHQTPFARYDSRSSTRKGSDQGLSGRKACIRLVFALLAILLSISGILALVIWVAVSQAEKGRPPMSVSSCRIPFQDELLLITIIEYITKAK